MVTLVGVIIRMVYRRIAKARRLVRINESVLDLNKLHGSTQVNVRIRMRLGTHNRRCRGVYPAGFLTSQEVGALIICPFHLPRGPRAVLVMTMLGVLLRYQKDANRT